MTKFKAHINHVIFSDDGSYVEFKLKFLEDHLGFKKNDVSDFVVFVGGALNEALEKSSYR